MQKIICIFDWLTLIVFVDSVANRQLVCHLTVGLYEKEKSDDDADETSSVSQDIVQFSQTSLVGVLVVRFFESKPSDKSSCISPGVISRIVLDENSTLFLQRIPGHKTFISLDLF